MRASSTSQQHIELDGRPGTVLSALQAGTALTLAAHRPQDFACLLGPTRARWAAVRRLRWRFPVLAALPELQLR